ncbi:hypothetical protein HNP38_000606 [Chryseobacterium defluvii]|uniref:Trimeric autotransporter adhesin YadA-like head domain-containing protein n=1 Tax=Chryseobacterium defluvii TaxID=160396 RepID=A0A840KC20_9FLAO|nr:hypothetical protein [Chryseobacterium defluvii]MBB4805334.1 hypothetical protein [Chryseobacterium defluvii]
MKINYFGKLLSVLLTLILYNHSYSQVGIGTSSPDPSAILEVNSTTKGLLLPRVALNSLTDATTIPSPATGLLVWNNGAGSLSAQGFYFWNNSQWNLLSVNNGSTPGSVITNGWVTTGNNAGNYGGSGTNLSFGTGTSDDLIFKVNSSTSGRLGVNNSVSFGNASNAAQNGIAIGMSSSSAYQATAVGNNAKANSNDAAAFGSNAVAGGYQSIAMGYNAHTNSNGETALGINSQTNNQNSTALGSGTAATGQNSTAIGYGASTSQANAIVLGNSNAAVGIGTATPNTTAKLDVNGQYKLGEKGNVHKNQISFEVWPMVSIANLQSGRTATIDIAIPAALQPTSTRASIIVSPANDFAGNSDFGLSNPRMPSTSTIAVNVTNISNGTASLYSGHFYVTINEF